MHEANSTHLAAWLQEMAAVGIPVDLSVAELDVEIEQVGEAYHNTVFDLPYGRAGYVIDLIITNQMSKPVRCRDIELRPPWMDSEFEWLPDPHEMGGDPYSNYRFPGEGALELPRDLVLNHVLLGGGILKPGGCPRQGCLLGIGSPMPENLRHGAWVQITLSIIAYNHNEYPKTINLWAERLGKLEPTSSRKVPRKSLFANQSAQGLGSLKPGDIGPAPARDSPVPRQPSDYLGREARKCFERAVDSEQPARNT
jgi:hypothetical protein